MKWPWHKKTKEKSPIIQIALAGNYALDHGSAIPIRITEPFEIKHTVTHKPYPKPHQLVVTYMSRDGHTFTMPPMSIRNGSMFQQNMPPQYANEWVEVRFEFYYGQ